MEKLGVERRLFTAGEDKGFLDPFSPLKPNEVQHVHDMLEDIHQQFINTVKKGRGDRLSKDPKLYSGLVWTGEEALNLGLVDSLGSSSYVARNIIKADKIVDYTHHEDYIDRFAKRLGTTMFHMLDRAPVLR
jgi:protease-4